MKPLFDLKTTIEEDSKTPLYYIDTIGWKSSVFNGVIYPAKKAMEEELTMDRNGIKARVEMVIISHVDTKITETVVVSDEYLGYCIEDRTVDIKGKRFGDVKKLVIDKIVIFDHSIEIEVEDTRAEFVNTMVRISRNEWEHRLNITDTETYESRNDIAKGELKKYKDAVQSRLKWIPFDIINS